MSDHDSAKKTGKREYSPPKIVHVENLTSRASVCNKADSTCASGGPGPLQS